MSSNFDQFLKSQMGLMNRLFFFRRPIKAMRQELQALEYNAIIELMYGLGWAADHDMKRIPETDCLAILALTPIRLVTSAGPRTCDVAYEDIAECYWEDRDLCVRHTEVAGIAGFRIELMGNEWTKIRRVTLQRLVADHSGQVRRESAGHDT